ncbi:helix-turn-helix domain-containing protein [Winogradskyella vincentii]|uniref:Helix-turn-helix domain-containing protein n=1 Tax=Winogradskyella vincentii TaxID=2877122 RepID=A0ABS7XZ88_9FLAO|nr:helix-turn-helix transcriptional regulator [Winogradskyella vincentii]MCA0152978.1 helix-turn-helix domain-containing protein [Winogradskyella vincentii]
MINNREFTNRLQKIIDFHDETASSFAEKIGVQRSSISHILSGRNKPSLDFVMKVLHTYPDVELYWLLNGKGNFPKNNSKDVPKIVTDDTSNEKTAQVDTNLDQGIEKIVIFYTDGTFKSYNP